MRQHVISPELMKYNNFRLSDYNTFANVILFTLFVCLFNENNIRDVDVAHAIVNS